MLDLFNDCSRGHGDKLPFDSRTDKPRTAHSQWRWAHLAGTTVAGNRAGVRPSSLLLTRRSVLTGRGAVSLSSFGGEGQGEEALYASDKAVHGRPLSIQFRRSRGGVLFGFFPRFSTGGGTKRLFSAFLITCRQPVRRCR